MFNKKYSKIIEIAKKFNGEIGDEINELMSNLTKEQQLKVLNGEGFSDINDVKISLENFKLTYTGCSKVETEESYLEVETDDKEWHLELVNLNKDWVDAIIQVSLEDKLPEEDQQSTDIFTLTVYDYDKNHEITRIVEHYLSVCKNDDGYFLSYSNTDEPIKQQGKVYTYEGENDPIIQNGKVVRDLTKVPTRAYLIYAMTHKPKNNGYDLTKESEYNGKTIIVHDYHELDSAEDYNVIAKNISKDQLYKLANLPCKLNLDENTKDVE